MSTRYQAFTVDHFRAYTSRLKLDNGEWWQIESFQLEIIEPFFAGCTEVWAILPEGNAKTTLFAGFALYHCDYTLAPWVPIAASSRDQANILARQAYGMIRASPGMRSRFKILEGYREVRSLRNGGIGIKVYAADEETADGVIPTLALCDEGHRWKYGLALYRLWLGKLDKRGGQIGMISTAGEPFSDFEQTRDAIRDSAHERNTDAAHIKSVGAGIVMNEWRVRDRELIGDMDAVKEANPLSAITVESLRRKWEAPTRDLGNWTRMKCNFPARDSNSAVTETEWDDAWLEGAWIPEGEHVDLGIDFGWKHDTTAIVPLWDQEAEQGFRLLGAARILTPPRNGETLPVDEVKAVIRRRTRSLACGCRRA